jgi:E3 ubiquitin-protein ligase synoviolin
MFYGLPIHIVRDLFLTARSFTKRLAAFLRYRRATQDMNSRYDDATVEDIEREDTCIICREEMRPWSVTNPQAPPAGPGVPAPARPGGHTVNERSRPKKLPCGHILHLGCLKSWLERQQVCPTCRAPVVDTPSGQAARAAGNNANPAGQGVQPPVPGQQDGPGAPPPQNGRGAGRGMRMLNFGPLRVGFGQANLQDLANGLGGPQANQDNGVAGGARMYGLELGFPRRVQPQPQAQGGDNLTATTQDRLQQIEQQIVAEIRNLQITQQELQLVQLLQAELSRLRLMQNGGVDALTGNNNNMHMPQMPQLAPLGTRPVHNTPFPPQMQRHGVRPNTSAIPSGSAELPPGVTIPEGWSLLPLQRLDGLGATQIGQVPLPGPARNIGSAPTATTQPVTISPMGANSNNNLTPTPTINPDNHSQTSSTDSSDGNAIHTPPSVVAGESNIAANTPFPTATTQTASSMSNTPASASIASSNIANPHPSVSPSVQLPNWGGSSQLFSNPGPGNTSSHAIATPASTSTSTMPPPPTPSLVEGHAPATLSQGQQAGEEQAQGQGQHVSRDTSEANAHVATAASKSNSASSEIGETSGARDEDAKEKGKARAATVEDTIDEAEGS